MVATEDSVVDVIGVVVEVEIELALLSLLWVVTIEVCIDVVGLSVEARVKDDVSDEDSTDITVTIVELEVSCDVCGEVGFVSEVIVETGGTDSVETVDATLSVDA